MTEAARQVVLDVLYVAEDRVYSDQGPCHIYAILVDVENFVLDTTYPIYKGEDY